MPITRAEYAELVRTAFADYAAASLPQTTQRAMEFVEGGDDDVDIAAALGPDAVERLCERGGRTRGSIPAFCTTALKVLGAAPQDDGVRAAIAQLDALKAREDALAAARREEAAAGIPQYSEYLRVLREHVAAFDPAAATAKARSELTFALLEVSAVPARERTLCPHKPRGGGDVCAGLVFAAADYSVAAHADGAALVDTGDGGYRVVLGDHTALRSKAAFAVSEPLAPLFPECTDIFDTLLEMLAARRAQLAPGDEPRVFVNHQKASGGLWGRNGFQRAFQKMFASIGGPAVGQFRKAVERHAETLYAAGSIDLARRATIHSLCQHKAATAQAAYVGGAGGDDDAAGSDDGSACEEAAGGDDDEAATRHSPRRTPWTRCRCTATTLMTRRHRRRPRRARRHPWSPHRPRRPPSRSRSRSIKLARRWRVSRPRRRGLTRRAVLCGACAAVWMSLTRPLRRRTRSASGAAN